MTHMLRVAGFAALLVFIAGCDSGPSEPDDDRVLGIIQWTDLTAADSDPTLEVPDTVRAASVTPITVRTWAPDECWSPFGADVLEGTITRIVMPYDRPLDPRPADCGVGPVRVTRTVPIAFVDTGRVRIVVYGRRVESGEDPATAEGNTTVDLFIDVMAAEEEEGET